jgi:hypothetical protein
MSALAEMNVQGVSTRKVKAVTETLCGHEFSANTISEAEHLSAPRRPPSFNAAGGAPA